MQNRSRGVVPLMVLLTGISMQSAAETEAPSVKRFMITDHGAVGDGQTLNTKAIQTAIDRCAAGSGGVVVVPKGTFLSGAIFLRQGVNLSVEKDGVLKGSINPEDYPQVKTRWEGIELIRTIPDFREHPLEALRPHILGLDGIRYQTVLTYVLEI